MASNLAANREMTSEDRNLRSSKRSLKPNSRYVINGDTEVQRNRKMKGLLTEPTTSAEAAIPKAANKPPKGNVEVTGGSKNIKPPKGSVKVSVEKNNLKKEGKNRNTGVMTDGTTPLILASAGGHVACVIELLEQGADPNARRITGTTALFFAAQAGHIDVAKILIRYGANIEAASLDGGTPLFVACQGGHINTVKDLISLGANVHAAMKDKATPVFIASQNGHRAVLLQLLAQGCNPNVCRIDGASPLWIAAQMGHDHIVRILLKNGAYVDAVRCDGATPLFKAAHKGFFAVVHELLKYGPNLYLLQNGETALHAAAMFGHLPVVKQLIAADSDVMWKNQDGYTALQTARQQNFTSVIEYLEERRAIHYARMKHNRISC